jgi:hypothetical protein
MAPGLVDYIQRNAGRTQMTWWKALPLLLVLSVATAATAIAQSPSLAGEWRTPYKWVLILEQDGAKVRAAWKQSYQDKTVTCSGIWFEGVVSGDRVSGTRNPCGGGRMEPLDMKVIDQDTLEMSTLSRGGGSTTTRLTRIK